jgi:hypothetical protein
VAVKCGLTPVNKVQGLHGNAFSNAAVKVVIGGRCHISGCWSAHKILDHAAKDWRAAQALLKARRPGRRPRRQIARIDPRWSREGESHARTRLTSLGGNDAFDRHRPENLRMAYEKAKAGYVEGGCPIGSALAEGGRRLMPRRPRASPCSTLIERYHFVHVGGGEACRRALSARSLVR